MRSGMFLILLTILKASTDPFPAKRATIGILFAFLDDFCFKIVTKLSATDLQLTIPPNMFMKITFTFLV